MTGHPMSEAPRDGTVIIAESMNYYGVPETGGYEFRLVVPDGDGWKPADQAADANYRVHYGDGNFLRWFPANTDPKALVLTERTNWNFIPSNGTAGECFYGDWCGRCIRERPIREDYDNAVANGLGCDIYLRSMAFKINDPEYPTEWTYKPDGMPKCTAFELDGGDRNQEPRCPSTKDLFE